MLLGSPLSITSLLLVLADRELPALFPIKILPVPSSIPDPALCPTATLATPLVTFDSDANPTPTLLEPVALLPARSPKNRLLLAAGLVLASSKSSIFCAPGGRCQLPKPPASHVHTFPASSEASVIKNSPY